MRKKNQFYGTENKNKCIHYLFPNPVLRNYTSFYLEKQTSPRIVSDEVIQTIQIEYKKCNMYFQSKKNKRLVFYWNRLDFIQGLKSKKCSNSVLISETYIFRKEIKAMEGLSEPSKSMSLKKIKSTIMRSLNKY